MKDITLKFYEENCGYDQKVDDAVVTIKCHIDISSDSLDGIIDAVYHANEDDKFNDGLIDRVKVEYWEEIN